MYHGLLTLLLKGLEDLIKQFLFHHQAQMSELKSLNFS